MLTPTPNVIIDTPKYRAVEGFAKLEAIRLYGLSTRIPGRLLTADALISLVLSGIYHRFCGCHNHPDWSAWELETAAAVVARTVGAMMGRVNVTQDMSTEPKTEDQ